MAKRNQEFKPDARIGILKNLYITKKQWMNLLRWFLYALVCVVLLVIQDTMMSRVSFFGVTTDLAPMSILLITVLVGTDCGSLFVLVASSIYFFSGSAPGAYCIALLTLPGILATMIRQVFWRRGLRSTVLCAGVALMIYELVLFGIGLVTGLTLWNRALVFLFTGLVSWALMLPLYPLAYRIGKIGGEPWKE